MNTKSIGHGWYSMVYFKSYRPKFEYSGIIQKDRLIGIKNSHLIRRFKKDFIRVKRSL